MTFAADLYPPERFRDTPERAALVIGHGFGIGKKSQAEEAGSKGVHPTLDDRLPKLPRPTARPTVSLNEVEDSTNPISYREAVRELTGKHQNPGTSFGGEIVTTPSRLIGESGQWWPTAA